jgi:serine/threonine protein kinase
MTQTPVCPGCGRPAPEGAAEDAICMYCLLRAGVSKTLKGPTIDPANPGSLSGVILDGKYRVEQQLGRGGMGAVYLATHLGTTRTVAVKVIVPQLAAQEEFLLRFQREAEAAGRLRHPNVVNVTDFGITEIDSSPLAYLVMEFLDGETLAAYLEKTPDPPRDLVLDVIDQVALGLDAAHDAGIVHRDLKPDNIWLESNRRGGYNIKVLDFGIAKLDHAPEPPRGLAKAASVPASHTIPESDLETLVMPASTESVTGVRITVAGRSRLTLPASTSLQTTVGSVMGTPAFMAPEQCQGLEVDHRADVYSLAIIAYALFCGRLPFLAKNLPDLMALQINAAPPAPRTLDKSIPMGVSTALLQGLSKVPEDRQQSAGTLAAQLRAGVEGEVHMLAQGRIFSNTYVKCFVPLFATLFGLLVPVMAFLMYLGSLIAARRVVPGVVLIAAVDLSGFLTHLFLSQLYKAAAAMVLDDAAAIGYFRPRKVFVFQRLIRGLGPMLGMYLRTALRFTRSGVLEGALWPVVWASEGLTGSAALRRSRLLAETQPAATFALVSRQYSFLLFATLAFTTLLVSLAGNFEEASAVVFSRKSPTWAFAVYPVMLSAMFLSFGTAFDFLYRSARRCLGETYDWSLPSGTRGKEKKTARPVRLGTILWLMPSALLLAILGYRSINHRAFFNLLDAAHDGRNTALLKAIDSGTSVDSKDFRGTTALALAATQGDIEMIRTLLARGANINVQSDHGATPLMLAVTNRQTDAARFLIEHQADVRLSNSDGRTALMIAAMHGDAVMCRLLLARGADPSGRDESNKTARDYAVEEHHQDVLELLDGKVH